MNILQFVRRGGSIHRGGSGADLVAGISIAGLLLPEAVAYSGLANLPPHAGVVALFAGLLVYAAVGRSRFAVVSATSSSAAIVAATAAGLSSGDATLRSALAPALVLLAGVVFTLAAVARLGSATDFIAKPVLRGFTFGLAVVIIIRQLPTVLGVPSAGPDLARFSYQLVRQWRQWNYYDIGIAAGSLALLFLLGRFKRVPGALLVIALGILANVFWGLQEHGIAVVGRIDLDIIRPSVPALDNREWLRLAEVSVALALVLYSESAGSIRGFAFKHGDPVTPNRDLVALGLANLVSGLFHGMPVGAGYSVTSANEAAGAQSRLSGIVAAVTILLLILLVLPTMALTPAATLAAIVIHAVSHTVNPKAFVPYFRWKRDRLVGVLAILAVIVLGVLDGLLAAVAISIAMMLRGLAQANVAELRRHRHSHDFVDFAHHPEALGVEGVLVLRPASPVFFANVDRTFARVRERIDDALAKGREGLGANGRKDADDATGGQGGAGRSGVALTVVLSLEESPDVDGTTLEALGNLCADVDKLGCRMLLARLRQPILDVLGRASIPQLPPEAVSFFSVDDAVSFASGQPAPPN